MNSSNVAIFVTVAFAMAIVVLLSKKNIPPQLRRGLAIFSVLMVAMAFCLIVYSFLA